MYSKTLVVLLVVYILLNFSHGHKKQASFRNDYTYIEAGESFYKIHTTKKSWRDAKQVCTLEGASLFYPENSDEANAVISFWTLYQNNTQPDDTWVFVGISDIITEGVYETIDGKSISEVYNNWKLNQPDNSGDEDCLHMNQEGYTNDIKCDAKYGFICKKSHSSLERNCSCNIQRPNLDGQRAKPFFRKDYNYMETFQSFYKIHTVPQTWADAKRVCALEGATFWHPDNDTEAHELLSFWNKTKPNIEWMYVGLSDLLIEGVFETVDGKSISDVYNKWQPGDPNNSGGAQDCVYIYLKEGPGYLDDYACDRKYSFICKKSLQSLEWNYQCDMPNLDYSFNENNGKCYKFHTAPLSWHDSNAVCQLEQSYLAVISNAQEADYLVNLTESIPKPRVKDNYQRGIYHVGFHNRFNEGWQTVKGTPMNLNADAWWDNYQPGDCDQCGSMFFNGRLINTDCDMKSFFFCEHELLIHP